MLYGAPGGVDDRRTAAASRRGGRSCRPARAGFGYVLVAERPRRRSLSTISSSARRASTTASRRVAPSTSSSAAGAGCARDRTRVIRRPKAGMANFGMRLRVGDVDGDGKPDLAEGAPARAAPGVATRATAGSGADGPRRCRALPSAGSTSGPGDRRRQRRRPRRDIVQGDSQHVGATEVPVSSGEVRVWLGTTRGPRSSPSRSRRTPRRSPTPVSPETSSEPSSRPATWTRTGSTTWIVAAVREDEGAGRVTVIRGGRAGFAPVGNSRFDQDAAAVPGSGAARPRVRLDARGPAPLGRPQGSTSRSRPGARPADERVMVVEGGQGVFAPDETRDQDAAGCRHGGACAAGRAHPPRARRRANDSHLHVMTARPRGPRVRWTPSTARGGPHASAVRSRTGRVPTRRRGAPGRRHLPRCCSPTPGSASPPGASRASTCSS